MKSIKTRLVGNFMIVILISIGILEVMLIDFVKQYYYRNVEEILTNQIETSADFYSRYFSNASLEDNILDDVDVFWKQTMAQVQIIDVTGRVLMDSIGVNLEERLQTVDVKRALNGETGKWMGSVNYDTHKVMSVTYPLTSDDEIVGVLRFITSLSEINEEIQKISLIFLGIGLGVIVITGAVSIFLANSITGPLKEVTCTAEQMALGNLKMKVPKKTDDEIGKLSDTLNYMAQEIIKKEQLKNEFISSVSHELRTPLTAIRGWTDTLNIDDITDRKILKDGLLIISKESERLTHMVEELLDFSKFVSGKITLNKDKCDVTLLINEIDQFMRPRAQREHIKFITQYEDALPAIYIDKDRIKQVLINLLDNAFKFTQPEGQVVLNVKLENNFLLINVQDSGCGIHEEELPKVKEKFYKGKTSKSQNGIGLSIVDEIIKLHEGIFEIESVVDKGTAVYIKLPSF